MRSTTRPPVSPSDARLWYDPALPLKLGCTGCPDLGICGGLRVAAAVFDCQGLCACSHKEASCSGVCRRDARAFVARVAEVNGFGFDRVPRTESIPLPQIPDYVPILYDGTSRSRPLETGVVAVPLMTLFSRRSGTVRFESPEELRAHFRVASSTRIIITGVAADSAIEAWWSFGDRRRLIASMRNLHIEMVTAPNYSLFTDVSRYDNLHNLKRIAVVTAELMASGMPCALHVNGRTDTDYRRLADYVAERDEIAALSFEFTTGCAGDRGDYHRERLVAMAAHVGRPLKLIVRGGRRHLAHLTSAFSSVSVLDADPYVKAKYRQRARCLPDGEVEWHSFPTPAGEPLDELLSHNIHVARRSAVLRQQRRLHADHTHAETRDRGTLLESRPA